MLPVEKVLNQVWQLAQKETKAQHCEKESEMLIILAHGFAPFPSRERAHWFPCREKKQPCVP